MIGHISPLMKKIKHFYSILIVSKNRSISFSKNMGVVNVASFVILHYLQLSDLTLLVNLILLHSLILIYTVFRDTVINCFKTYRYILVQQNVHFSVLSCLLLWQMSQIINLRVIGDYYELEIIYNCLGTLTLLVFQINFVKYVDYVVHLVVLSSSLVIGKFFFRFNEASSFNLLLLFS